MRIKDFSVNHSRIIACIWDFDRTLSPDYTQKAVFDVYGLDLEKFWEEVNLLPDIYKKRGIRVADDDVWQNHMISYVKNGLLPGLSNRRLREIGENVRLFSGLPEFFIDLKNFVEENYGDFGIVLEHYIVSGGIAEVIRGSRISEYTDGIFACEFIENPVAPGFTSIDSHEVVREGEISQVGMIVDNAHKTQAIFEINKGCNKDPNIRVNATIERNKRRIPMENMIYIADGPSDIPAFTVVRNGGGLGYAVYNSSSDAEFEQNDRLLSDGRVDSYGPADYTKGSSTVRWLKMHIKNICERICYEQEELLKAGMRNAPVHIHENEDIKR